MTPEKQIVTRLYQSFAEKDFSAMASLYHPHAVFSDPVFVGLNYCELSAMWEMFCKGTPSLNISLLEVSERSNMATAMWKAEYIFPATGRHVVNRIKGEFTFHEGLILKHQDHFGFYRWAIQAFGIRAWLPGLLPVFRQRVQIAAMRGLLKFMKVSATLKEKQIKTDP